MTETTVIAVRLGRSRRDKLADLRRLLLQRDISPAGFVLTTRDRPRVKGYYYSRGAFVEPLPQFDEAPRMSEGMKSGSNR